MAGCACLVVLSYAVAIGINTSRVGIRAETAVSCLGSRCRGRAEASKGERCRVESGRGRAEGHRLQAHRVEPWQSRSSASCLSLDSTSLMGGKAPSPYPPDHRCVIAGEHIPTSKVHKMPLWAATKARTPTCTLINTPPVGAL